ncbi:GNAT family N-acetyltransferase [Staphylococcus kloosii]|jgi:aminoglycoside 6'-N-acetyltransferase I|uniref:GNAT family N-acetyltransferase n=1 Tax=Staphylococcus kloosii TaxID=29384 RepID=UPI0018A01F4F|nr:GNAT family N-acetyltransferase [Staphylococcus kloosii]MBF7024587.1 GNAT family N-acetyltransferase [Staphylococcus kloosii]
MLNDWCYLNEDKLIESKDYIQYAKNLIFAYAKAHWHNKWTEEEALFRIEATLSGFNSRGYIVEVNENIIAMCIGRIDYYFNKMHQFCIDDFHVIPMYQGEGVGTQLMNYVSESLKVETIYNIFLITGGTQARNFYERVSFKISNEGVMMINEL